MSGLLVLPTDEPFATRFLRQAGRTPARIAISDDRSGLSYGQLAHASLCFAAHMQARGLRQGQTIGLATDDLAVLYASIVASSLLGCRWSGAVPTAGSARLANVDHLFTSSHTAPTEDGAHRIDQTWAVLPDGMLTIAPDAFPGFAHPDDDWLILPCPDRNGARQPAILSTRAVSRRCQRYADLLTGPQSRIACVFPMFDAAFIQRALAVLWHGGEVVATARTDVWVQKDVSLVAADADTLERIMRVAPLPRRLAQVHVCGSLPRRDFFLRLLDSFDTVAALYERPETGAAIVTDFTRGNDGTPVGKPRTDATEIRILSDAGQQLAPGEVGQIWLRNDRMASGYRDNPAATSAAFRGGWFHTGEPGRVDQAGEVTMLGASGDVLVVAGKALDARILDKVLRDTPGIQDAICFMVEIPGRAPRLTAMVRLAPGPASDEVLTQARIALIRVAGRHAVPERFHFAEHLPYMPDGAPDRAACAAAIRLKKDEHSRSRK